MIHCSECPRFEDRDKVDYQGNHFGICKMTGNIVYPAPRKEKRYNGHGYIHFGESSCGLFNTFEEAFAKMTKVEQERYTGEYIKEKNSND